MKIICGDSLEQLKQLEDASVDSVVTDPPYGLKFMNKHWDYDVPSVEVWTEVLRVLKSGGHLLSFGGTRTYHRMVVAIEDAGFEIRDQIQWLYGSGFPKSHNLRGEWQGWGTALKPANEPIVLARKPFKQTVAKNVAEHGTGALNIDGCRVEPSKDYGRSAANAKGTINAHDGFEGKSFKIRERDAEYASPLGRWPANVILDEEAGAMLDAQSGVLKSGKLSPEHKIKAHNGFEGKSFKMPDRTRDREFGNDTGGASRFFYCAKASKSERNAGLEGMPEKECGVKNASGRGFSESDPYRKIVNQNNHPTVKPIKLMRYLCRLVTPPNGTVLDPYCGSGTTGIAAKLEGFNFIGIEREQEYVEIAEKRIEQWHRENES